jgi:hypothetical protein
MKMQFRLFIVREYLLHPNRNSKDKITTVAVTRKSDFKKNNSAESPQWMFIKKRNPLFK